MPVGTTLLGASKLAGAPEGDACGGVCACSTCHVYVMKGRELLSEAEEKEEDILDKAFDVRPAVRDQVKSVGAEFLTIEMPAVDAEDKGGYAKDVGAEILRREQELFTEVCRTTDIVVTTALIAGKTAPLLLTAEAVAGMRPGSVIVDLAVEQGGNGALARPGERVDVGGVSILGFTNLASRMPQDASRLYARNVLNLLAHLHGKEGWKPDFSEEVTKAVAVVRPEGT